MLFLLIQQVFQRTKETSFRAKNCYYSALLNISSKLKDPDVQRMLRTAAREDVKQDEREAREAQRKEYSAILKSVSLDERDEKNIEEEATRLALDDLAAGRISISEHGACILRHAKELTDKRKRELATAKQFNDSIRNSWRK